MITNFDKMRLHLMSLLPPIGEEVTISLDNSRSPMKVGPFAAQVPDTIEITGKLVEKPYRIDNDSSNFALFVNDSPVKLRIISVFSVVAINGVATFPKKGKSLRVNRMSKTFKITGSEGAIYTVSFNGKHWTCTCPGYHFRKNCRHVKEAKEQHGEN